MRNVDRFLSYIAQLQIHRSSVARSEKVSYICYCFGKSKVSHICYCFGKSKVSHICYCFGKPKVSHMLLLWEIKSFTHLLLLWEIKSEISQRGEGNIAPGREINAFMSTFTFMSKSYWSPSFPFAFFHFPHPWLGAGMFGLQRVAISGARRRGFSPRTPVCSLPALVN